MTDGPDLPRRPDAEPPAVGDGEAPLGGLDPALGLAGLDAERPLPPSSGSGSRRRCWPRWPTACPSPPTPNPLTPPALSPNPSGPAWNPPSWPKPPSPPARLRPARRRRPPPPLLLRRLLSSRWRGGGARPWRRGRRWRRCCSWSWRWRGWPGGVATPGRGTWKWPAGRPRRPGRRRLSPRAPRSRPNRLRRPRPPRPPPPPPGRPARPGRPVDHRPAALPAPAAAAHRPARTTPAPPPSPQAARRPASTGPGPPPPFYDSSSGGESAAPRPASPPSPPPRRRGVRRTRPPIGPEVGAPAGRAPAAGRHDPRRHRPGGRVPGLRQPAQPGRRRPRPRRSSSCRSPGLAGAEHDRHRQPRVPAGGRARRGPGWATGPLLETLTATERPARPANGAVFSFASPPERQGHLAADALFPSDAAAGTTAVIYARPAGPLRDVVPAGHQGGPRGAGRNVHGRHLRPGRPARRSPPPTPPSSASTPPPPGPGWPRPRRAGYRPAGASAGIYTLADDALAPRPARGCPGGLALRRPGRRRGPGHPLGRRPGRRPPSSTAGPPPSRWRRPSGGRAPTPPAEVQTALEGLAGWSSGLAPPYETRPGTRPAPRKASSSGCSPGPSSAQGGFRRDPYRLPSTHAAHRTNCPSLQAWGGSLMNRPFRRLLLASAAAGLCAMAAAGPALACAGLVTPGGNVKLLRTSTLAAWADGYEHYVTSFTFQGGGAEFGSIVPLPGNPVEGRAGRRLDAPAPRAGGRPARRAAAGTRRDAPQRRRPVGRGALQHPDRRPRHHDPPGRRRVGRPVGPGARLPAHARRPRGPRLLRRPVADLHGRPLQRRRRQGTRPGRRRGHARST